MFGQAEWKENSFQICIEFPFSLYKRRIVREAAYKQLKAKKNTAQHRHCVIGQGVFDDTALLI